MDPLTAQGCDKLEEYCSTLQGLPYPDLVINSARRIYRDTFDAAFQEQHGFHAVAAACMFIALHGQGEDFKLSVLLGIINAIDKVDVPLVSTFQAMWHIEYNMDNE